MKYLFITAFLFSTVNSFAQIDFELKSHHSSLLQRANAADSAILAGQFGTVHSLLIIHDGRLVFEKYYNGWTKDSLHQLQSATKSIISTLLGCALQQKYIESENELISAYFPKQYFRDNLKKQMRISDLLTQRHGLTWNEGAWEDPGNDWRKIISRQGNWYDMILRIPMDTMPGTRFVYGNAAPTLVSAIIQQASKLSIDSFAVTYLFKPLGIRKYWFWQGNGDPPNNGMALVSLTSRDMAKIGQLYLQNGKWDNNQVIPFRYVQSAVSSHVKAVGGNGAYKQYDYGYFWWSNPVSQNDKKTNVFLARGAGGQNIIVNRDEKLVVVTTAWNMQQPNKVQLIYDWYLAK